MAFQNLNRKYKNLFTRIVTSKLRCYKTGYSMNTNQLSRSVTYFQTKSADCVMGFKTKCIFYFFCSVLTIVNGIPQRKGSNVCIVSEAGSSLDKPCQFPFVYKDKTYNECTLEDGGGVAWCSTKTTG